MHTITISQYWKICDGIKNDTAVLLPPYMEKFRWGKILMNGVIWTDWRSKIMVNELHVWLQLITKGSNWQVKHWRMMFYSPNLPIFPTLIFSTHDLLQSLLLKVHKYRYFHPTGKQSWDHGITGFTYTVIKLEWAVIKCKFAIFLVGVGPQGKLRSS